MFRTTQLAGLRVCMFARLHVCIREREICIFSLESEPLQLPDSILCLCLCLCYLSLHFSFLIITISTKLQFTHTTAMTCPISLCLECPSHPILTQQPGIIMIFFFLLSFFPFEALFVLFFNCFLLLSFLFNWCLKMYVVYFSTCI